MLQTAVVGVGFIGAEHIEAIRRTNLATVAAIVGRSPEQTDWVSPHSILIMMPFYRIQAYR